MNDTIWGLIILIALFILFPRLARAVTWPFRKKKPLDPTHGPYNTYDED